MKASRNKMDTLVKKWQNSGLSKAGFCRENGIPLSTFSYWCSQCLSTPNESKMVKIPARLPQLRTSNIILEYPSGYKLHIPGNQDLSRLEGIISVIKSAIK
jgi:hypothetical protein